MSSPLLQIILVLVLLAAVWTDLQSYRIPNWLTMPAMSGGLLLHTLFDGQAGLLFSIEGLALGLSLFTILYMIGGMGAGDVKLLAVVGSFVGPEGVFGAAVITVILGGVYAVVMMVSHDGLHGCLRRIATMIGLTLLTQNLLAPLGSQDRQPQLRYALVIALGTILSLSHWQKFLITTL